MRNLMRMVTLIIMLGILAILIEVVKLVVMMRAMLVVMMKVMTMAKDKDTDGESKFDCGDVGDSNNGDGFDDGVFVNIIAGYDANCDNGEEYRFW